MAVAAQVILLPADLHLVLVLAADGLEPIRIAVAMIGTAHRPWSGQGIVVDRDVVAQDVRIGLVEVDALVDYGLAVLVERHAAGIITARALDGAGLDQQQVISAVTVFVLPVADRVA